MAQQDVNVIVGHATKRVRFYNVNTLMSVDTFTRADDSQRNPKASQLLQFIYAIPGVQHASITRYEVAVTRSLAYEWDRMHPAIEGAIIAACADGNLVSASGNPMP